MINKIDFIYIPIDEPMEKRAKEMARARRQNWKSSKHISDNDDYYGALGELSIRKLLYLKGRKYTFSDARGKSDNGIDIEINAGTVNIKTSNISPELYYHIIAKEDVDDKADYFIQCFLEGDECIFVGMETRGNLIREENLKKVKSKKYNTEFMGYKLPVKVLSIKPYQLISDSYLFTLPKL